MNRRPPGLQVEKTIQGFLQFKAAAGLSKRTIESYASDLRMWLEYQGTRRSPGSRTWNYANI